jgi:hypothetical protein
MLKKVNIQLGDDRVAKVAHIIAVKKDKSSVRVDLYAGATRTEVVSGDMIKEDGRVIGEWTPKGLLAQRAVYLKGNLPFTFTLKDYQAFYPKVVVLTAKEKKVAEIASIEAQIKDLSDKLTILKGE